jgi:hypothetical protein
MYRGHILAEWENIFDIADIDGNRRGGQDFFCSLYWRIVMAHATKHRELERDLICEVNQ